MVQRSTDFRILSPRSDDKLFQSKLDACIEGIEKFPVTKRLSSIGPHFVQSVAKGVVTLAAPVGPSAALPSPPPSPQRQTRPLSTAAVTPSMNRAPLHGGPVRDSTGFPASHQGPRPSQDVRLSQDARSNLAVQPAANTGSLKLKKNAVKIVSPAGPQPSAPLAKAHIQPATLSSPVAASSFPTPVLSPALELVASKHGATKENRPFQHSQSVAKSAEKPDSALSAHLSRPSHMNLPSQPSNGSLDDMFARLSAASLSTPSRPAKELHLAGPDMSLFSFYDDTDRSQVSRRNSAISLFKDQPDSLAVPPQSTATRVPDVQRAVPSPPEVQVAAITSNSWSDSEMEYLCKAALYLDNLPSSPGDNTYDIKAVAGKLRNAYAPDLSKFHSEELEKLRARLVFSIVNYVNKQAKLSPEPLAADFVKKLLRDSDGDFLRLCAALVEKRYIMLDNLDHVTNLCQTVLDVLPKTDSNLTTAPDADIPEKTAALVSAIANTSNKLSGDPLESMKAWPTQEKREHGAVYRACILKGVGDVKTLNQLQALVWGGRLESISPPEPGSEQALVKFLTPEACQNYLNTTENGIVIEGGAKKIVVFVDKQPGPNSINDVIQNCIDGDASRCVRATGADDDWSDGALFKLARGKQQIPRDVDRIKQGKTSRGHHYIEFRFGNIYHALNFKRYLTGDEDWEHCSIGYVSDPCEVATGVHYKDEDE